MVREIIWSAQALEDYRQIWNKFNDYGPAYSARLQKRLMRKLSNLLQFPFSGRRVLELNINRIRQFTIYRYRVIYVVEEKCIILGMFFHGARRMTGSVKRKMRKLRRNEVEEKPKADSMEPT